jgi:hypothetical protein
MPAIAAPFWLLTPLLLLLLLAAAARLAPVRSGLPGFWPRAVAPALRAYLGRSVVQIGGRQRAALLLLLALLLGAALSGISLGEAETPSLRDLHARVLVIDLGLGDASAGRVAAARRLVDRSKEVPTAVVAVTGRAFDIVPLTRDHAYLDRYLGVLSREVMPIDGRSPMAGIARAAALLRRAGIEAPQIVLLSGAAPPPAGGFLRPEDLAAAHLWLLPGDGDPAAWNAYAERVDARLAADEAIGPLLDDLERRRLAAVAGAATIRERRDLTPWLILLALPFWLSAFCRRRAA